MYPANPTAVANKEIVSRFNDDVFVHRDRNLVEQTLHPQFRYSANRRPDREKPLYSPSRPELGPGYS